MADPEDGKVSIRSIAARGIRVRSPLEAPTRFGNEERAIRRPLIRTVVCWASKPRMRRLEERLLEPTIWTTDASWFGVLYVVISGRLRNTSSRFVEPMRSISCRVITL